MTKIIKVGLFGAIANNMFLFARAFNKNGVCANYIHDNNDNFLFSQPFWEEERILIEYDEVMSGDFKKSKLTSEYASNWKRPPWFYEVDINNLGLSKTIKILGNLNFFGGLALLYLWVNTQKKLKILSVMSGSTHLLVCGIEGAILALISGKPFIIWPHGGDIRTAQGLEKFTSIGILRRVYQSVTLFLLRKAYDNCIYIGQVDPKGLGGHLGKVRYRIEHLPIPLVNGSSIPTANKAFIRKSLSEELNIQISDSSVLIFIPSRIDYYWKGTDWLIDPINSLPPNSNLEFIFSGWGNDYSDLKAKLNYRGVTFLNGAISKPIIYDFYKASDLVIDQFKMEAYGSSGLEALSCGTPLMVNLNSVAFEEAGWGAPPPVINVSTRAELDEVIFDINSGTLNLATISMASKNWAVANLKASAVVNSLVKDFETFK